MNILKDLAPQNVFAFFEELCAIPHGSGNMGAISDYCLTFAQKRGLQARRDEGLNVILSAPASPGYEKEPPIILQGHLDMVCEKEPDSHHDFTRDALRLRTEGDRVWAEGTTLGADDGIAVAMILAVLDDKTLPHPPIEALLTVDEEVGMLGAENADVSSLQGRRLINLDSEVEGVFTVSCAGGNMTTCTLPLCRQARKGTAYELKVSDLLGGHSGVEIHKGRGNANVLLGRVLYAAQRETDLTICSVSGGQKDNAIPLAAQAVVAVSDEARLARVVERCQQLFSRELLKTDPAVSVTLAPCKTEYVSELDNDSMQRLLCMMLCAPNGVQAMSWDIPGLVQTSLNFSRITVTETEAVFHFCLRSSLDSQRELLNEQLCTLTEALGGSSVVSGTYPGWAYRQDSPLRTKMVEVFEAQYGRKPTLEAIHAGVECGLLCGRIPGLDAVSIGPDLTNVHTSGEYLSISSVQRVWRFLLTVLRDCKG